MKIVIFDKAIFISLKSDADDCIRKANEIYGFRLPNNNTSKADIEEYLYYLCGCQLLQSYGKDISEDSTNLCIMVGQDERKELGIKWEVYETGSNLKKDLLGGHFLIDRYIWKDIQKYGCRLDVKKRHKKKYRKVF